MTFQLSTDEFKREAVQMLLGGHKAGSVAERLALVGTNQLYRWKREQLERSGPVATSLEARIQEGDTPADPWNPRNKKGPPQVPAKEECVRARLARNPTREEFSRRRKPP